METFDSVTVHIGDLVPGIPAGAGEGCFLGLWPNLALNLTLNCPHMSADEFTSFGRGISRYSYQELGMDVPVALWRFEFGRLMSPSGRKSLAFRRRL